MAYGVFCAKLGALTKAQGVKSGINLDFKTDPKNFNFRSDNSRKSGKDLWRGVLFLCAAKLQKCET